MAALQLSSIAWLGLGAAAAAGFLTYTQSFGKAQRKVLASGLMIAAVIYALFAMRLGISMWLLFELAGVALFGLLAWSGLHKSSIWLAAGWILHPLWDAGLHLEGFGASYAPRWYVIACISFDVVVGLAIYRKRHQL